MSKKEEWEPEAQSDHYAGSLNWAHLGLSGMPNPDVEACCKHPSVLDLGECVLIFQPSPKHTLSFYSKGQKMKIEWLEVFPEAMSAYVYPTKLIIEQADWRVCQMELPGQQHAEAVQRWLTSLGFQVTNGLNRFPGNKE